MEPKHKRRIRYKGTHPKKYNEKYKELNPELYPETIEKVIKKGSTPVGMHLSIMVDEILEFSRRANRIRLYFRLWRTYFKNARMFKVYWSYVCFRY